MEGYYQTHSNRTKLAEDQAYPFLVQEFERLILGLPRDHQFENDEENDLEKDDKNLAAG